MPDAVLLAGGESRRFGRNKTTAVWLGRPLAHHVRAALPASVGRTVMVLRQPDAEAPVGTDVVTHDAPDSAPGPLAGVVAGLRACAAARAWVVACDLPGLRPEVLEILAEAWRPEDRVLAPVWRGRPQPLCALYSVAVADALEASGSRSLLGALEAVGARHLPAEAFLACDPRGLSFHNVNTPADLEALATLEENGP